MYPNVQFIGTTVTTRSLHGKHHWPCKAVAVPVIKAGPTHKDFRTDCNRSKKGTRLGKSGQLPLIGNLQGDRPLRSAQPCFGIKDDTLLLLPTCPSYNS